MYQSQKRQRIYIFGSSRAGVRALEYFQNRPAEYEILGWLDNDAKKHGTVISGYEVYPPQVILGGNFDRIWVASCFAREIRKQLRDEFHLATHQFSNVPMSVQKGHVTLNHDHKRGLAESLLMRVSAILMDAGLPFYVDHGTLLGIVRDGDLLPWDNDVDLAISAEHVDAVRQVLELRVPELNFPMCASNDWRVGVFSGKIEFEEGCQTLTRILKVHNAAEDDCSRNLNLDLIVKYAGERKRYWMVSNYTLSVDRELIEPLSCCRFKGIDLPTPGNVAGYLTALYNDWRTPVKVWDHTLYANVKDTF